MELHQSVPVTLFIARGQGLSWLPFPEPRLRAADALVRDAPELTGDRPQSRLPLSALLCVFNVHLTPEQLSSEHEQ